MLPSSSARHRFSVQFKRSLHHLCALGLTTAIIVASSSPPVAAQTVGGLTFAQTMNVGYAASRQGDFNTALINFRRALTMRPNNPYAAAAADNMAYYIQYERVATRQRAIDQLESRLARATAQKDWICAATTIDQLTTYTTPNSLDRERLTGRRGEIGGLLDARTDYESWSTVCTAQRPVY
ncbi:MAG: tetratricopeptide repeat protein [Phormidesmis sp.]